MIYNKTQKHINPADFIRLCNQAALEFFEREAVKQLGIDINLSNVVDFDHVPEGDKLKVIIRALEMYNEENKKIAGNYMDRDTSEENEERHHKDVKLIAAAPDLLAAAKEFVRRVDTGEVRSVKSYNMFKAAIAKAEGK